MNNIETIIDHAEQNCKEHGGQLTNKRKQVLSALLKAGRAMSAYELLDYYKSEFDETLPAMSVYRILDFLQQEQLVHKLKLANKFIACSHICCDHAHAVPQFLICSNCQKVKEISIKKQLLEELENNVTDAGFHLVTPQFEMNCLCDECLSATKPAIK